MRIETDVLVIGGGGSAARAAIEVANSPVKVCMVIKGTFPSGSTTIAMGSMAGIFRGDDNPDLFYQDVLEGGYFTNNKELAHLLADNAKDAYDDLVAFGTEFQMDKNRKLYIAQPTGMARSRAVLALNHDFMKGLVLEVKKRAIPIYEHIMITDLLKENKSIIGAVGFNYLSGAFVEISAKAVILATGGLGQLFELTSNLPDATGDGFAIALRVGAELIDMEFTQAMTCVVWPPEIRGLAPPFDGFVKFGAKFYNGNNERFMARYEPEKMENVTRDIACLSGFKEVQAGRAAPHGGVILDISSIPWAIFKQLMPKIYEAYNELGMDATKTGIEWAPGCHHEIGGLRINANCETTVQGLFAAGEVVGGIHGANRLGGASLTDTQVFGKIAGRSAADFAIQTERQELSQEQIEEKRSAIFDLYQKEDGIDYTEVREKIQQLMSECVWVIKTEAKLKHALNEFTKIQNNLDLKLPERTYEDLKGAQETLNLLKLGELLTRASLLRTESRGCHFREDFPQQDNENWLKNIVFYQKDAKLKYYLVSIEKE